MFGICLEFYSYICRYFKNPGWFWHRSAPCQWGASKGKTHLPISHWSHKLVYTQYIQSHDYWKWIQKCSVCMREEMIHRSSLHQFRVFEIFLCAKSRWCGIKCQYRSLLGKLALPTATRQANTRQHFMMVYCHWKQMHHLVWPCLKQAREHRFPASAFFFVLQILFTNNTAL